MDTPASTLALSNNSHVGSGSLLCQNPSDPKYAPPSSHNAQMEDVAHFPGSLTAPQTLTLYRNVLSSMSKSSVGRRRPDRSYMACGRTLGIPVASHVQSSA